MIAGTGKAPESQEAMASSGKMADLNLRIVLRMNWLMDRLRLGTSPAIRVTVLAVVILLICLLGHQQKTLKIGSENREGIVGHRSSLQRN